MSDDDAVEPPVLPQAPVSTAEKKPSEPPPPSRLGSFIQTYSSFLSSFVIGVAGLIATSIWQYRQAEVAHQQAASAQKLAEIKAENDWRIERAEILSKNLGVLSSHGVDSAEQRYGVLLSLTRGNILDPELAVSYALELGRDNPGYMHSVLTSTVDKNYTQLLHAFSLTCIQRYGVAREVPACTNDKLGPRSDEIAELIADEQQAALAQGKPGPLGLLADEQQVKSTPGRLAWLFEPYLSGLYERRQFREIESFEKASVGARLISAVVLATAHTGELLTAEASSTLDRFHQERRKWLASYLFSPTCDGECKSRLIDVMLSVYGEAQGDYDESMRRLLSRPRAEVGAAVARLHQRLLWCQVDTDDLALFRDAVLVPALAAALGDGKTPLTGTAVDDVSALLAMTPAPTEPTTLARYAAVLEQLKRAPGDRYQKAFVQRRSVAERERRDPPPVMKKITFCNAAESRLAPTEE